MGCISLLISLLLAGLWYSYRISPLPVVDVVGAMSSNPIPIPSPGSSAGDDNEVPIRFQKTEKAGSFQLAYTWQDYSLRSRRISFDINKRDLEASELEFGYFTSELENFVEAQVRDSRIEMIKNLKKYTERQIAQSEFTQYLSIREAGALSFNLSLSIPPSQPPSLYKKAKAEYERITLGLAREQERYLKAIEKEISQYKKTYLENRGFRLDKDTISVNYNQSVKRNRPRVRSVVGRIRDVAGDVSLNYFLALILSFVQEIQYGIPPTEEQGKIILGFWPPLKVLVNNFGDCDSKGVTFASMWMNYKKFPVILIKVPEHLFVGLAIPSLGREGIVINGLRYTLCEVTGKDKMPPGLISAFSRRYLESGRFRYEIID